jgi:hypothetical protein
MQTTFSFVFRNCPYFCRYFPQPALRFRDSNKMSSFGAKSTWKKSEIGVQSFNALGFELVSGVAVASSGFGPCFGLGLRRGLLLAPSAFGLSRFGYNK